MANKLNTLIFHSGSGGHFISQQLFRTQKNYSEFTYKGHCEYIKGASFKLYEKVEQHISRPNNVKNTILSVSKLPLLAGNYYYTGHLAPSELHTAKENLKTAPFKVNAYTLYGVKSYGLHTIMGRVKRYHNGNQSEMFTDSEVTKLADSMEFNGQIFGNHLDWDKFFLEPDIDYITNFFHDFGCYEFEYSDYWNEYMAASLRLVIDYYPTVKYTRIIRKFPKDVLERVL